MDLTELQILFQQKIQDVSPRFDQEDRPDSFSIVNYLNKTIKRYLNKKYVSLPSYELRLAAINSNIDELHQLIQTEDNLPHWSYTSDLPWSNRGKRYRAPDNVLIPFSLSCQIIRSGIYPAVNERIFALFANRKQAERLVSNSYDKVMFDKPVALWDDPYNVVIIGDAYTSYIGDPTLTYVKKPFELSFDYNELVASSQYEDLDISVITDGSYFLMKSHSIYVDTSRIGTYYMPGEKVQKIAGYDTVYNYGGIGQQVTVGYPWGYTDTPEFPEHLQETLVDMAVEMFLEEGKLKLTPKADSK